MLKVKNLVCGYPFGFTLKDISFEVKRKEFLGIIGPNGSGKTTLLKTISKILKPMEGEIILDGKNIESMSFRELARKIAVVPQVSNVEFGISVEEFVLLGRTPYRKLFQFLETKSDEDIALNAMELTEISALKERPIIDLSGGERQLASIARALAQQPQLMLLDEPTAHLDIAHQVRIMDLLRKLNEENSLTVIAVLHDLNLASEYCDRILLMREGRLHSIGKPEEVMTYPTLEEVYNTLVVVEKSPISGRPYVVVVPSQGRYKASIQQTTLKKST